MSRPALFAWRAGLLSVAWIAMAGLDPAGLAVGIATAAAAAAVSVTLAPSPARPDWLALARLIAGMLAQSVRGGLDVTLRALHPALPEGRHRGLF